MKSTNYIIFLASLSDLFINKLEHAYPRATKWFSLFFLSRYIFI